MLIIAYWCRALEDRNRWRNKEEDKWTKYQRIGWEKFIIRRAPKYNRIIHLVGEVLISSRYHI